MKPTPERTDDKAAQGIHPHEMTAEEHAAVAQAMATYLTEPVALGRGDDPSVFMSPIVPGEVRHSRGGAAWVSFDPAPRDVRQWFRLTDIPAGDGYEGGRVVHDADGRPLGNAKGPLILHKIRGKWLAQGINTGWTFEGEIHWT